MAFVQASALALPFPQSAVECVISLDMLEHVPLELRHQVLIELLRVAQREVILGFPCGKSAQESDAFLYRLCQRLRLSTPEWLAEHMQYEFPDEAQVVKAIRVVGMPFGVMRNEGLLFHKVFVGLHLIISHLQGRTAGNQALVTSARLMTRLVGRLTAACSWGGSYRRIFIIKARGDFQKFLGYN